MAVKIPKTNPELVNKMILRQNLYTGPDGLGEYVGEVDDLVLDWQLGFFRIVSVDSEQIPELKPWTPPVTTTINDDLSELGLLNARADEYIYIDQSASPFRVSLPASVTFAGSQKKYVKLFLGSDITEKGTVISAHYDEGLYIGENIPLEKVIVNDHTNDSLKTMKESYINSRISDGELITAVVYSESGQPTDIREFSAVNSNYVRSLTIGESYITGIELNSSFFSENDARLLEVPMNVSLSQMDLTATIRYRGGQTRTLAIDGNKVRLEGIDNYISNTDGKTADLNLVYRLSEGEYTLNASGNKLRSINTRYQLVTKETEGNYTVKLYVAPIWKGDDVGYELEYYLYDLDRGNYYYATPYVEMGAISQPFQPKRYGVEQWLTVAIDVNKANRSAKPYRHVQTFAVSLLTNGLSDMTPWLIRYDDDGKQPYGNTLEAVVTYQAINDYRINIDNNFSSTADFLNATYYAIKPLVNTAIEQKAPPPTHFIMDIGGVETEHVISEWNNTLNSAVGGDEGNVIKLHWIRKVGGQVLHLGMSPLIIRSVMASIANRASAQVFNNAEKLYNTFLSVPDDVSKVDDFNSNTVIEFNEDGTFELWWPGDVDRNGEYIPGTGYVAEWMQGDRDITNRYEISVAVLSRWQTSDGTNKIELLLNGADYDDGTFIDLSGDLRFSMESDFEPSTAEISLSIAIRRKDNNAISAIDAISITKR